MSVKNLIDPYEFDLTMLMKNTILVLTAGIVALLLFAHKSDDTQSLATLLTRTTDATTKIPIDAKRWYQVNNVGNGLEGLFDGITDVPVRTGWDKLVVNYDAYYPLLEGEQMTIERIRFYDSEGSNEEAPLTLSIITDNWQRIPIAQFTGTMYNTWVGPDPANLSEFSLKTPIAGARYLVINTSGAFPSEMELYGSHQPGKAPTPTPVRNTPFRQAIGANAFEWNVEEATEPWKVDETRIKAMKGLTAIRHYLDWEKLEGEKGNYTFNPTASGSWNYDAMYERLQAEGIDVLACLKTIPKWLEETYPTDQQDHENTPAPYGSDLSDPKSYIDQARAGFQFMARYGSNKNVNPALVRVSPIKTWAGTNTVKIGLGLIRYIECENERDKTWKGRQAYQTAREYAANLSAFYDGHKNSLGPGVGVKNADPSATVVIGGLAASTTDYMRAMIDWCREFRGYKPNGQIDLCWDVFNQHLYANDAQSSQGGGSSRGAAPEVSGVGEQAAEFLAVSHQYAHDMPVWITETGYDVHPESPLRAISIGRKSVLETQADWILRTALLFNRVGIERVFFYELYDDNLLSPVQFYSMGLIHENRTRKPAADYLFQANNLIGNYRYRETINKDPLVDRYELNGRSSYVLVIPDEKGRTGTYNLPVFKGDTIQVCTPAIGRDSMTCVTQVSRTGTIALNVSETPVFVVPKSGVGTEARNELGTLEIYPNPTADVVQLTLDNGANDDLTITVYGSAGRQVRAFNFPKSGRVLREQLDLSVLPAGLYLLDIRQGPSHVVRKIIRVQ